MAEVQQMLPKDFIQTYIIRDLDLVVKVAPYLSFALMALSIEFLGKCLNEDEDDFHEKEQDNYKDFERAINGLNSFIDYRAIATRAFLQNSLRNGMIHSMLPRKTSQWSIGFDSGKCKPHELDVKNKNVVLQCEQLYKDIKNAANEIITRIDNKEFKLTGKMYQVALRVTP